MTILPIVRTPDGRTLGIDLALANRHGLVTGATGGGKTVTLQRMAEQFSAAGVPVFAADIKGDLSGLAAYGDPSSKLAKRAADLGEAWAPDRFPVRFWDLYGEEGIKIGTSVDEMGVAMMARVLDLNDTQAGVLNVLTHAVHDGFFPGGAGGLRTLDCIHSAADMAYDYTMDLRSRYGHVSPATLGMIQRQCLALHAQNGWRLFREPAFNIADLMEVRDGRGVINLLVADRLMEVPRLYSTFLLYLLTDLFRTLPEVGDLEKPKLVFFFDEAHLLFANAPKNLLETIERLVRLIRSKGVGVYFVTQSPRDVPESVLAQLGNRVQHALRAFTPKDQRLVKAAAQTFRANPGLKVADAITQLAVGECLFSPLVEGGVPAPVERCMVLPPTAQVGPISDLERQDVILRDPLRAKYGDDLDDEAAADAFEARVHPKAFAARQKARAETAAQEAEAARIEALRRDYEENPPGRLGLLAMMVGLREVHPYLRHLASERETHGGE